jgi:hypothetical protein
MNRRFCEDRRNFVCLARTAYLVAAIVLTCASPTDAETFSGYRLAYRLDGSYTNHTFGFSASVMDDVSGDGVPDFIVGAPTFNRGGGINQSVFLFRQRRTTADVLMRVDDELSLLGYSVAGLGDVNGNGSADFGVGSIIGGAEHDGIVQWFDGGNRTIGGPVATHPAVFHHVDGGSDTHYFGTMVQRLGERDLLEATRGDVGGFSVLDWFTVGESGITRKLKIRTTSFRTDPAIKNVGDLIAHDGIDDFLLASDNTVFLISGATPGNGETKHVENDSLFSLRFSGTLAGSLGETQPSLGQNAMATIGDITGDGVVDFAIGAYNTRDGSFNSLPTGGVGLFNGANGQQLAVVNKPAGELGAFGSMIVNVGDVDGDGHVDLALGDVAVREGSVQSAFPGKVHFYSPFRRQFLGDLIGESNGDAFGSVIVPLGDLNGDDIPELGVGAYLADFQGTDSGSFYVYESTAQRVIARANFDEPPLGSANYHPGPAAAELGFQTTTSANGGSNPLAATIATSTTPSSPVLSHSSINALTRFDFVDIARSEEVVVSLDIQVRDTGYEDGDFLHVYLTNGAQNVDIVNAVGSSASSNDALEAIRGGYRNWVAAVPADWTMVSLVIQSSSNSSAAAERYDFDSIRFRGVAVAEPSAGMSACTALLLGFVICRRGSNRGRRAQ